MGAAVGATDASEDGRDMGIAPIERRASLGEPPGQRREPSLDRGDAIGRHVGAGRAGGDGEPDRFGVSRQGIAMVPAAPATKVSPVGGVCPADVLGLRPLGVGFRAGCQAGEGR